MNVYRLHPEYNHRGGHYAHWVDDDVRLMDTPQNKIGSVLDRWPGDLLFDLIRDGKDGDVYTSAVALFFTQRAVDDLGPICDGFAEWLPVTVRSGERLYIFHPTSSVPLGPLARYRSHAPGDNIIEIFEYDFASPETLPCCFLIRQPESSDAGKAGTACIGEYITDKLYSAMSKYRGVDFARIFPPSK